MQFAVNMFQFVYITLNVRICLLELFFFPGVYIWFVYSSQGAPTCDWLTSYHKTTRGWKFRLVLQCLILSVVP